MYGEANQRSSDDTPEQRAPLRGSEVPALGGLEESVEILAQFSSPRNASIRQAVLGVRYEEPSRSSSHNTAIDERLRGRCELVAGEYDLKRASLCEVLGGQEMRETEGVLRVGLRHPAV